MNLAPLLRGEHIRLTAINQDDLAQIAVWYQDPDFIRLYEGTPARPRSDDELHTWLDSQRQDTVSLFGIRPLQSNALLGLVDISGILWTHGTGWIGLAIGEPSARRQGFGTEAATLALDFAFWELNLHRIQLTVFGYNTPAIKLYQKLGFTLEGTYRECLRRNGKRYDMFLYGILSHEWEARRQPTHPAL